MSDTTKEVGQTTTPEAGANAAETDASIKALRVEGYQGLSLALGARKFMRFLRELVGGASGSVPETA